VEIPFSMDQVCIYKLDPRSNEVDASYDNGADVKWCARAMQETSDIIKLATFHQIERSSAGK